MLPPNASPFEIALERAAAGPGVDVVLPAAVHAATAPADLLPWLAWGVGADDWSPGWSVERKRAYILEAIALQRKKGTLWAVRRSLELAGYGVPRVIEDRDLPRYGDADLFYGSAWAYGPQDPHWADYWIEVDVHVNSYDAALLAERARAAAPARCRLRAVTMVGRFYEYGDGVWLYGDPVTYGGVYEFGG